MNLPTFELERYFARYEFTARYLLSASDCEALEMQDLLVQADPESRSLWDELNLGYTESMGHPVLREAVAGLYATTSPAHVLTVVPQEGIFLGMHAMLSPGDHVICTFPGYQSLYAVARAIGCDVSFWEPTAQDGFYFDLQHLDTLLRPETKLVVVNFPHNPTGWVPAPEVWAALVEGVARHGAYLLSDEMYRFLELPPASTLPPACDLYERAVSLGGLSKSFGLPGLRTGWVATRQREVIAAMARLKDYTTICASGPSEVLALMALRAREAILDAQRSRLERNVAHLTAFFTDFDDVLAGYRPGGGSICFPRLRVAAGASAFCEELIRRNGIMLVPSTMFAYGDRHVRIGFGRENLPHVLERFADYLRASFR